MVMETTKRRVSTRSPVALARKALQVARQAVPAYASKYSKHDFTQHQLLAMLVLEQFFRTDDRGMAALLTDLPDLCRELGLAKVPHHTTLFHARKRLVKKGLFRSCSARSFGTPRRVDLSTRSPRRQSTPPGWRHRSARPITPAAAGTATAGTANASFPS